VEGWGWDGRVGDTETDDEPGILSRAVGRKAGAAELTREARDEFEALGAECWREMESLRLQWEALLGVRAEKAAHGQT